MLANYRSTFAQMNTTRSIEDLVLLQMLFLRICLLRRAAASCFHSWRKHVKNLLPSGMSEER